MSAPTGLTSAEAARRLEQHGPNEVEREPPPSPLAMLADQFRNPMVALLLVAAVVAGALGEVLDASAIAFIVVLNAVVGFVQEFRAEKALKALRDITSPHARVERDGRVREIPSREVVDGDVLLLEAGDVVPADAKVLEESALHTIEAALTGESLPIDKSPEPVSPDTPLADRTDHVYAGTTVSQGTGRALVVATGMQSELGRIAGLLAEAEAGETPLKVRLRAVSQKLLILCLVVVAAVAALGFLRGRHWLDLLLESVSLAVAAIPEGLPAVVTIALAAGVQRMAGRRVLVRKLPAVETLGCTTVICTDKTGTLTTGEMRVRDLWGPDREALVDAAVACNNAVLEEDGAIGDPTEVALLLAGRERGIERDAVEAERPRVHENPFDSDRKRMSILREDGVLYVKGAFSSLAPLCTEGLEGAAQSEEEMAASGLRVLAVAVGEGTEESELRLLGLVGIADPPRPEAVSAVAAARSAGIRTVMITGDHEVTARAIAREIGILGPDDDPEDVVHARVTPEDKIEIVRTWKERGEVVAMTGDGVNDAPAVREAHIGIAMGQSGTEVTREAASVVLTDDNFASIVEGIREGRTIYDNIRKTIVYLLRGNMAELVFMFSTALVGLPVPLVPIQLLWLNLVTDGLPALALVMEPPNPDVMRRPPRSPQEPILGAKEWKAVIAGGAMEAVVVFSTYAWALTRFEDPVARTLAFDTLVASELLRAFAARSTRRVLWELGPFSNGKLLLVVFLSGALQIGLHLHPELARIFHLASLSPQQLALAIGLGFIPVSILELYKLVARLFGGDDE